MADGEDIMADGEEGPVVIDSTDSDSDSDGFCIEAAPSVPATWDDDDVKAEGEAAAGGFEAQTHTLPSPSAQHDEACSASEPSTPGSEDIAIVQRESSALLTGGDNHDDAGLSRDQDEENLGEDHPADADTDAPPPGDSPPHEERNQNSPPHEERNQSSAPHEERNQSSPPLEEHNQNSPPHEERDQPGLFSCPFCPEVLPNAETLQGHCSKEHYCPTCDRYDIPSMAQHMEEVHKPEETVGSGAAGGFVCCEEGCEETFETEQEMLEHYGNCPVAQPSTSQKPDETARDNCPLCNKVYPKKMTMRARKKHEEACIGEDELLAPSTRTTRASKKQKRPALEEAEVEGNEQEPDRRASSGQNGASSSRNPPRKLRRLSDLASEEPPAGPSRTTAAATTTNSPKAPPPANIDSAAPEANAAAEEGAEEVCCFCGRGDDSATAEEGSLRRFSPPDCPAEILCHEPCAAFCDHVKWIRCAPLNAAEVAAEATRAADCSCGICGRQGGAALTCLKCLATFHLPCARERARKHAANMTVFVFSDIDPNTGESHGGVLCPQHAAQRDSWRDFDAGPQFSGVWFENASGGWRNRAHGISYHAAVLPESCEAPNELRRSEEAAADDEEGDSLSGGTEMLGIVMSKDAAALCREQMQKWADARKEADETLDAEEALFGDGMVFPARKGPRDLEKQFRSLSSLSPPASLDVVNLEAKRSPGGLCPVCRPGSNPCNCLKNVRQLIVEQIPMKVSMKIRKQTGCIDPEDLPKRLRGTSDGLRIGKVKKNDPRKHLAERRDYAVLAARRFERGDVVALFKGYICTIPEFRQELRDVVPDGFSSMDQWRAYLDEASHDLISDAPWQKTNSTRLTLTTYRMPAPDDPLKLKKRPVFCGNEAILVRQSVASRSPKARTGWNDRYFDLGKLEKAKVDSAMHFHRPDRLGNVDIMEFAVCGFPFPFIMATAPIEKGEELLLPPILEFWRHWNANTIPLLQHPKLAQLSSAGTANGSQDQQPAKAHETNDDDDTLRTGPAASSPQEQRSKQVLSKGIGHGGASPPAATGPDHDNTDDGFDLGGDDGDGAQQDAEPSSSQNSEWGYADAQLVMARGRMASCLWSEVAANEGPGFVTGEAAAAARKAAMEQAAIYGSAASAAAANPSMSGAAAQQRPRGSALRRNNVDPWANAQAVRSRAGGFINRVRSRELPDKPPGAS